MKKNTISRIAALVLAAALMFVFTACGNGASPDSIVISYNGSAAEEFTLVYDPDAESTAVLTALVEPEGFSGALTWTSDDAGVAKVDAQNGPDCTLSLKKPGSAKITVSAGNVSASVKVTVVEAADYNDPNGTAVIINGKEMSVAKLNIFYVAQYSSFVDSYGSYAMYFGLDTSNGLYGLENQACEMSQDGTWRGYFLEQAVLMAQQIQALNEWASANSVELDETDLAGVETTLDQMSATAVTYGFAGPEEFLSACYGKGVTMDLYREYLREYALGFKAYSAYMDTLGFSDEELDEYYLSLGYEEGENEYNLTSMRHILIMAEAGADGSFSEEALSAARARAEELYAEWLAGDKTEESFAELANAYSDDGGSNTNGGFYGDITKGQMMPDIDSWLFAGREYGDTTLIDINDRYAGTHIVFFAGEGELYSRQLALSGIRDDAMTVWFNELCENCPVVYGDAIDSACRF